MIIKEITFQKLHVNRRAERNYAIEFIAEYSWFEGTKSNCLIDMHVGNGLRLIVRKGSHEITIHIKINCN